MALTAKQARFVEEYLVDLNATQAAIRAGYSKRTAGVVGCENLTKPNIQKAISERQAERSERTKVNADYVLSRLIEIDQMDVADILNEDGEVKPVRDWPKVWRQTISGFDVSELYEGRGDEREMVGLLKKMKWPDKLKNIELLGKHVDIQAFREQKQVETSISGSIEHTGRLTEAEIDQRIAELEQKLGG